MDIEAAVYGVVADMSSGPTANVGPDWSLNEEHGIDSLDFVELVQRVEVALDIRLPDEEVAGVRTAGDLLALCRQKLAEKDTLQASERGAD